MTGGAWKPKCYFFGLFVLFCFAFIFFIFFFLTKSDVKLKHGTEILLEFKIRWLIQCH